VDGAANPAASSAEIKSPNKYRKSSDRNSAIRARINTRIRRLSCVFITVS
jgi:hypothetical protein